MGLSFIAFALAGPIAASAQAGSVAAQSGTVTFNDDSASSDRLTANITSGEQGESGWVTNFFDPNNGPTAGPGCAAGFVGVDCATGTALPVVSIRLGASDDRFAILTNPSAPGQKVTIDAGPGDDQVTKNQTVALVDLGPGDDTVEPDDGGTFPPAASPGDVIRGGAGNDTADYSGALDPIRVILDGKPNDGREGEHDNLGVDIENVIGSELGGNLIGSNRPNHLVGRAAARRIVGAGGRDLLEGTGSIDALDGRGGDRVNCFGMADTVFADAGDIVSHDCARIRWAPKIASPRLVHRAGRVRALLACPAASKSPCVGRLRLATTNKRRLATRGYRVRPKKRRVIVMAVKRRPPRRATLYVAPKGGNPIAGRAVRIVARR